MNLVLALAGALLLSLICEKAEAQVAREAFYSIPSETVSAADFLTGKKGTPIALAGQLRFAKTGNAERHPPTSGPLARPRSVERKKAVAPGPQRSFVSAFAKQCPQLGVERTSRGHR